MKREIEIKQGKLKRSIGPASTPFLIAEMSGNHNQSIDRAIQIIEAAAASGAHAIKLQTYTADTMTLNLKEGDFLIQDEKSLWKGRNLYDLYHEAHTPWEWHAPLFQRCLELGMFCFSTPFDETAVDFLEKLEAPFYKIASFENTCIPLIKKVAKTGKPIIISTGMASEQELRETVDTVKALGLEDLVLLKCTSTYPASPENTNIITIPAMRDKFEVQVGLSDHTMGCGVAIGAVALGATVIEKHFTLRRADGGVDSTFSMEPSEFKTLAEEAHKAWQSLGMVTYGTQNAQEEKSKMFRRSIYVTSDVKKGDVVTEANVRCIRPGFGLPTKHFENILGKKFTQDLKRGTPMKLEFVKLE